MNENKALTLPDESQFTTDIQAINKFQQIVKANMVDGHDYGTIPGTQKPTLLKPGAEKIAKLLGLADQYEILDKAEDWQAPFFRYLIKCQLIYIKTGTVISEGLGECNSYESKYRWRWVWPDEVPASVDKQTLQKKSGTSKYGKPYTQYRIENDDIFSQVNTILKMSKKRALVDAALSAGRLSDVFTQDLEDIKDVPVSKVETKKKPTAKKQPEKKDDTKPEPQTAGELMAWVSSHGKEYNSEWVQRNFSCTLEDIQKNPAKILGEIKEQLGW